jgi:uncharacterized paraquat-inducible protein A
MTNSKVYFILITSLAFGLALTSCGNKSNNTSKIEQTEKQGKEYTSAYVCPMHCEGSGSHEAGECPVCGMDYVKNEAHSFACPMHPEVKGVNGDKCSKCGMKLTSIEGEDHSSHNH